MLSRMSVRTHTHNEVLTKNDSINMLKNIVKLGISLVTYLRNLFEENAYEEVCINELKLKRLLPINPQAHMIINWLEKGVFEAIEKEYLRILILDINDIYDNTIECYKFSFSYNNKNGDEIDISLETSNQYSNAHNNYMSNVISNNNNNINNNNNCGTGYQQPKHNIVNYNQENKNGEISQDISQDVCPDKNINVSQNNKTNEYPPENNLLLNSNDIYPPQGNHFMNAQNHKQDKNYYINNHNDNKKSYINYNRLKCIKERLFNKNKEKKIINNLLFKKQAKDKTYELLRSLVLLTQTLEPLPERTYLSMKLLYYDEIVPYNYQPPYFRNPDNNDLLKFIDIPNEDYIGKINTGHHFLSIIVNSTTNNFINQNITMSERDGVYYKHGFEKHTHHLRKIERTQRYEKNTKYKRVVKNDENAAEVFPLTNDEDDDGEDDDDGDDGDDNNDYDDDNDEYGECVKCNKFHKDDSNMEEHYNDEYNYDGQYCDDKNYCNNYPDEEEIEKLYSQEQG
ncbi:hypothetical protein PFTANZ_04304 [Plasmodium falciparum Tanzania (2000708)]|uniref:HORMA domain-containing protein n=1 Tax=Plasmodium falciparum Tanzania (2000708) TaxID=1036725 RepID=A0A024W356_PLAFA|nr:hypothetical protein PFTANZ_04304 [Plasmodium falciparum Tanzania (2000708)]